MATLIDTGLYWQLPGPVDFMHKVALRMGAYATRVLVINSPAYPPAGMLEAVLRGVLDSHIVTTIQLAVRRGTDIANDVGVHFGGARLTAAQLAEYRASEPAVVLLQGKDDEGQEVSERYVKEFLDATCYACGNIRLVTFIHRAGADPHPLGVVREGLQSIDFDGGLSQDEMDAYVALRMVTRPGPGTTRLLRTIVGEFSGYDAHFAERIIELNDDEILGIQNQLDILQGEQPQRWRTPDWLSGTKSFTSPESHVLHDYYLSKYGATEEKIVASERIARRYWRACLKAIIPWLEERRRKVLQPFRMQLCQLATGSREGRLEVPTGPNKFRYIDPEEVEYNNIVGLYFTKQLHVENEQQEAALRVCQSAKRVRDEIAHMRVPKVEDIVQLIERLDAFV